MLPNWISRPTKTPFTNLPYSVYQGLLKPRFFSKFASRAGVQRLLVSRSQMGWAGLEGPLKKRRKTLSETRVTTTNPDSSRLTT